MSNRTIADVADLFQGWLQRKKEARVADVTQLPPSPDGRQYRYEIAVKLSKVAEAPDDDEVREIADTILEAVEDIDHPDWPGADELYIQIYSPNRDVGSGACGSVHWVDGEYELVEARPYLF